MKKQPPFIAGEEIRVYGYDSEGSSNVRAYHKVVLPETTGWLWVKFVGDDRPAVRVHSKQCRRVTKRSAAV